MAVMAMLGCGECWFCARAMPSQCERTNPQHYGPEGELLKGKAGGVLGYSELYGSYDGGQAEKVRVPFADFNLKRCRTR